MWTMLKNNRCVQPLTTATSDSGQNGELCRHLHPAKCLWNWPVSSSGVTSSNNTLFTQPSCLGFTPTQAALAHPADWFGCRETSTFYNIRHYVIPSEFTKPHTSLAHSSPVHPEMLRELEDPSAAAPRQSSLVELMEKG